MNSRLCFFALVLVACSGRQGSIEHAEGGRRVDAPGPGAEQYSTSPSEGDIDPAIESAVREASAEAGQPLVVDARLSLLARHISQHMEDGSLPSRALVSFFAHHLGLTDTPHFLVRSGPAGENLKETVAQFIGRQTYHHYGAHTETSGAQRSMVVAFANVSVDMQPVPRRIEPGTLRLRGELAEGFDQPTLVVTQANGAIERMPLGSSREFLAQVPLSEPGPYQVELLGMGPTGSTVVANFPLYVGQDPPDHIVLRGGGVGEAEDEAAVEAAMLDLLNQTRQAQGLRPVERMTSLDAVSRAHSVDMRDNEFFGHVSPTTGDTPDRMSTAAIRSGLVLENIGQGYGATEIHEGLMGSPGHRANILNAQVTHVGIGAAEQEGSPDSFFVTEVFIQVSAEVDAPAAEAQLLAAINRARVARGVNPVEAESHLTEAAQEAARRFFAEPTSSRQDVVDDASRSLRRFGIAYRRIGGLMTVVGDVSEAERLEPTFEEDVGFVGIGVAQGTRPDSPPNSIGVVIIMAWPR